MAERPPRRFKDSSEKASTKLDCRGSISIRCGDEDKLTTPRSTFTNLQSHAEDSRICAYRNHLEGSPKPSGGLAVLARQDVQESSPAPEVTVVTMDSYSDMQCRARTLTDVVRERETRLQELSKLIEKQAGRIEALEAEDPRRALKDAEARISKMETESAARDELITNLTHWIAQVKGGMVDAGELESTVCDLEGAVLAREARVAVLERQVDLQAAELSQKAVRLTELEKLACSKDHINRLETDTDSVSGLHSVASTIQENVCADADDVQFATENGKDQRALFFRIDSQNGAEDTKVAAQKTDLEKLFQTQSSHACRTDALDARLEADVVAEMTVGRVENRAPIAAPEENRHRVGAHRPPNMGSSLQVTVPSKAPETLTRWRYKPYDGRPIGIRHEPKMKGPRTGERLQPGDVFDVSSEHLGKDGVLYLQLANGRGWVFDQLPGEGQLCERVHVQAPAVIQVRRSSCASPPRRVSSPTRRVQVLSPGSPHSSPHRRVVSPIRSPLTRVAFVSSPQVQSPRAVHALSPTAVDLGSPVSLATTAASLLGCRRSSAAGNCDVSVAFETAAPSQLAACATSSVRLPVSPSSPRGSARVVGTLVPVPQTSRIPASWQTVAVADACRSLSPSQGGPVVMSSAVIRRSSACAPPSSVSMPIHRQVTTPR